MLPDILGREKVDRLPIVISLGDFSQLIAVPILKSGKGIDIAQAVYDSLKEWDLTEKIQAACFDTTASNTGRFAGASTYLKKYLNRDLMDIACRQHIHELSLRDVFETKLKIPTSSPNVPLFENFKKDWKSIEKSKISSGLDDRFIKKHLSNKKVKELKEFYSEKLKSGVIRGDYKEFLELILVFISSGRNENPYIRQPGACHHARWMAKAIYTIKIFLFRKQLKLPSEVIIAIRDICLFLVLLYAPSWFSCTNAIEAPRNDLSLIKRAIEYQKIDIEVTKCVLKKISNHLWYISDEAIALSFFDPMVSIEEKRSMVVALSNVSNTSNRLKVTPDVLLKTFSGKEISHFVTANTYNFFTRFNLNNDFLQHDPTTWNDNPSYIEASDFCKKMRVVNDIAERNVKLIKDFNNILVNTEDQKQFLLHVVSEYRKQYPSFNKSDLS